MPKRRTELSPLPSPSPSHGGAYTRSRSELFLHRTRSGLARLDPAPLRRHLLLRHLSTTSPPPHTHGGNLVKDLRLRRVFSPAAVSVEEAASPDRTAKIGSGDDRVGEESGNGGIDEISKDSHRSNGFESFTLDSKVAVDSGINSGDLKDEDKLDSIDPPKSGSSTPPELVIAVNCSMKSRDSKDDAKLDPIDSPKSTKSTPPQCVVTVDLGMKNIDQLMKDSLSDIKDGVKLDPYNPSKKIFVNFSHDLWACSMLHDIIELKYQGSNKVVLFKCHWWDVCTSGRGYKEDDHGFFAVNVERELSTNATDPYVLASQAQQVYYVEDINNPEWHFVIKIKPCDLYDIPVVEQEMADDQSSLILEAIQENDRIGTSCGFTNIEDDDDELELARNDAEGITIDATELDISLFVDNDATLGCGPRPSSRRGAEFREAYQREVEDLRGALERQQQEAEKQEQRLRLEAEEREHRLRLEAEEREHRLRIEAEERECRLRLEAEEREQRIRSEMRSEICAEFQAQLQLIMAHIPGLQNMHSASSSDGHPISILSGERASTSS